MYEGLCLNGGLDGARKGKEAKTGDLPVFQQQSTRLTNKINKHIKTNLLPLSRFSIVLGTCVFWGGSLASRSPPRIVARFLLSFPFSLLLRSSSDRRSFLSPAPTVVHRDLCLGSALLGNYRVKSGISLRNPPRAGLKLPSAASYFPHCGRQSCPSPVL